MPNSPILLTAPGRCGIRLQPVTDDFRYDVRARNQGPNCEHALQISGSAGERKSQGALDHHGALMTTKAYMAEALKVRIRGRSCGPSNPRMLTCCFPYPFHRKKPNVAIITGRIQNRGTSLGRNRKHPISKCLRAVSDCTTPVESCFDATLYMGEISAGTCPLPASPHPVDIVSLAAANTLDDVLGAAFAAIADHTSQGVVPMFSPNGTVSTTWRPKMHCRTPTKPASMCHWSPHPAPPVERSKCLANFLPFFSEMKFRKSTASSGA